MTIGMKMDNIKVLLGTEDEFNGFSNHLFDFNKIILS